MATRKKPTPKKTEEPATNPVEWFHDTAPYINAHRGRTFVLTISGAALEAEEHLLPLIHDIALLHSLGVRLILVHGARPQIETRLQEFGLEGEVVNGLRITDEDALECVKESVGSIRMEIEGKLSIGLPNSPMAGAHIRVASGNFVTARPLGIRDGVDYQHTGEVRRVDVPAIENLLDNGFIVLLSPTGYSPTGEIFNLSVEDVATAATIELQADKLLSLVEGEGLLDDQGKLIKTLTPEDAEQILAADAEKPEQQLSEQTTLHLISAIYACREGVPRIHLIHSQTKGALLQELFTRDGVGTLITADLYETMRPAEIEDIGGILELLHPLEVEGILVQRPRELLEIEINHFTVMERDGTIIGVVALYPYAEEKMAELACLAVHPAYQNQGYGKVLFQYVETQAREKKLAKLFVLSTRTAHWFREQGLEPGKLSELPIERQQLYNYRRNSKIFFKTLVEQSEKKATKKRSNRQKNNSKNNRPKNSKPRTNKPKADEAKTDESTVRDSKVDQSTVSDSKVNESKTDASKVDESKTDESKASESQSEVVESKSSESNVSEPQTSEPQTESTEA